MQKSSEVPLASVATELTVAAEKLQINEKLIIALFVLKSISITAFDLKLMNRFLGHSDLC